MVDPQRRKFLTAMGVAAATASVAGCSDLLEGDNQEPPRQENGEEDQPNYSFSNVETTGADVSNVENWTDGLEITEDQYGRVTGDLFKGEDHVKEFERQIPPTMIKGEAPHRARTDFDQEDLQLTPDQVPITVQTETGEYTEEIDITKQKPIQYFIQGTDTNGNPITDLETPFEFDQHQLTRDYMNERNSEMNKGKSVVTEDFDPSIIEGLEQPLEILKQIDSFVVDNAPGDSGSRARQAYATKKLFVENTEYDETDLRTTFMDNPTDDTKTDGGGGHGSKIYYFDGNFYHSETNSNEFREIGELLSINSELSLGSRYFSVPTNIEEPGEIDQLTDLSKVGSMNQVLSNFVAPFHNDIYTSDVYGSEAMKRMGENQSWDDVMPPVELAADILAEDENDAQIVITGTPDDPHIIYDGTRELSDFVYTKLGSSFEEYDLTNTQTREDLIDIMENEI